MHIIVLGGAGAMGRVTVRALLDYPDIDQVTIADYNEPGNSPLPWAAVASLFNRLMLIMRSACARSCMGLMWH